MIGFKCALIYIKGDWMEFATTVGLTPWGDALRPCYDCCAFGAEMFSTNGISLEELRWYLNQEQDYFIACDRCEHFVILRDQSDIGTIMEFLRYDKRDKGSLGRTLTRHVLVNGIRLKLGDRLEPSYSLPDIGALEEIVVFPKTIVFWRRSEENMTRHRNPIFDKELGVTPSRSLTVDVLHAFFLGVLNTWCKIAVWKLILCGAYGNCGNVGENLFASTLVLRDALMRFYVSYKGENPTENITRVADLTAKMLGSANKPKMKTKGAETWGVALFLISEIRTRITMLGEDGDRLLQAGMMLERIVRIWKANDWTIPRSVAKEHAHAHISHPAISDLANFRPEIVRILVMQCTTWIQTICGRIFAESLAPCETRACACFKEALDCFLIHIELMRPYDCFLPKHHLMIHPLQQTLEKGNPWFYGSWLDETLNKTLKAACRNASQMTFEYTVLLKMLELLRDVRGSKRQRGE